MSLTTNRSDELDQIDVTIQSLAATRRILNNVMVAKEPGGEHEQELDEINVDLDHKYRNKNMTELDTEWCGCCISLFGDTRKSQKWKDDTGSQEEEIVTTQPTPASSAWGGQAQGALIKNELEDEMEVNLQ